MPDKKTVLEVSEQVLEEFSTEFMDTKTFVPSEDGALQEAGSVLRIGPNIIFLKTLTLNQLKELKTITGVAVDYELNKRL